MLPKDGSYTAYIIQHLSCPNGNPFHGVKWVISNLETFAGNLRSEDKKVMAPFMSVGECYQQTGIHGTFKQNEALTAVLALAEVNPGRNFRVAQVNIEQSVTPVYEIAS